MPSSLLARALAVAVLLGGCTPETTPEEGCSNDLECANGERCDDGACVSLLPTCDAPLTACSVGCVELSNDSAHCGSCETACGDGRGCVDSTCCPAQAPMVCGGACVDPSTEVAHCGGCGQRCEPGLTCTGGLCCAPGEEACDGLCVDRATSAVNCGACGVRCPAGQACEGGSCGACPPGEVVTTCNAAEVCLPLERTERPCMALVPAATFAMGEEHYEDTNPIHDVEITTPFLMDLLEVSQAEWQRCLDAGACSELGAFHPELTPDLPATWMSWEQADVYCRWRGGSLPTEAQWELAARGTDGRRYPWGEDRSGPPPKCHAAHLDCADGLQVGGRYPTGRSPYGLLDLVGNAEEWVADWYAPYLPDPQQDPTGPATAPAGPEPEKVTRGEDFRVGGSSVTATKRGHHAADWFDGSTGTRCVLPAP